MKYDGYNIAIYQLISPQSNVLDIGCATGRLGERLKLEKNCFVSGIEFDPILAVEAEQRYDHVLILDLEKMETLPFETNYFDYIICSNVLEHIRNPEEVIEKSKPYLKDQGKYIIALPNIAFISERIKHLFGRFEYSANGGLMDVTHVKLYTLKTAKELIHRTGLTIEQVIPSSVTRPQYFFLRYCAQIWKTLFALEFIFICKKR
ncbi:MAG: class I SAM-dependent methyltransferase [bacterium]|nr:class I SAM-dependent methyltransferase [bacterium]